MLKIYEKEPVIQLSNVTKIYDNDVKGLDNVNLNIEEGEFVAIIGLSGAGKSTLLRAINRLHDVTDGDIKIDGQSITQAKGKHLRHIRRDIGMIFQGFNLVKRMSVAKNVLTGRVAYYNILRSSLGLFSKEDKQKAFESLQRVGMENKFYNRADELSGGQQQRVAIARVLTQSPKIILADEPVASLDPKTTTRVMDDLKQINQELKMTVMVNLHSVELAKQYATRFIGIRNGVVVLDSSAETITDEQIQAVYQTQAEVEEGALNAAASS
ncbi:phosphonate ABC transporter ATP-binding protein [Holzapfeliella sp. JNUCC 80]